MTSSYKIPLYETPSSGMLQFRKNLLYSLIFALIIIGFLYLYKPSYQEAYLSFGMLSFMLFYPIFGYWDSKNKAKFFIQIEDDKITFKNSIWIKFHELQASEIQFVEINLTDIHISTNDFRSFNIEISLAKDSDIKHIKQKLSEFRLNL